MSTASKAAAPTMITGSKLGITLAAMGAAMMAILDISIVNVALSDIRASFGTPLDQIAWVSTGYMMANVVVIPMTGWLQRRFGYKRYFTASIALFIIASALCGIAWNLPALVAFRILQGMGGGAIIPTAQSILFARYPREEHGMAGALFGIGAMTGPLLGPTLGGYLIELSTWHWIFLINVPIGIFATVMAWRFIEEPGFDPKAPAAGKIDTYGIALLAVGMASLQYVLEEGNREGWFDSVHITLLAVVAAIALVTFIVHELETESPVVDLSVFKSRSYSASTGLNFLIGTVLFSGGFLFSLYCGAIMHYRALDIGLLFLKGSAIQLAIMPLVGRFGGKVDGRYLIFFGVATQVVSLWLNGSFTNQSSELQLLTPIFIRAVGLCFVFVPLSVIALSDLSPEKRGNGAGLFNLTRELGGSIGTAWMSSMLSHNSASNFQYLTENVTRLSPIARESLLTTQVGLGWKLLDPELGAAALLNLRVNQQALIRAFNQGFTTLALVFAVALILVLMLKKPHPGVDVPGAH
jgi:DHA2 family multidrug resistance protein